MPTQEHPNENIAQDQNRVMFSTFAILIACFVQLAMSLVALGWGLAGLPANIVQWTGISSGICAVVLFFAAGGTYRGQPSYAKMALLISSFALVWSFFLHKTWYIGLQIGLWLLILQGVLALNRIVQRVGQESQDNRLTQYYHAFLPILIRVMKTDGHVDRREKHKILQYCDQLHISPIEQRLLLQRFMNAPPKPIEALVEAFVQAAGQLPTLKDPKRELMVAVLAVIESDGIIADEEIQLFHEIGHALRYSKQDLATLLVHLQADLDKLDPELAYEILNLPPNADTAKIESAYRAFMQDFMEEQYGHLGTKLAAYAEKRKRTVERAYLLLSEKA